MSRSWSWTLLTSSHKKWDQVTNHQGGDATPSIDETLHGRVSQSKLLGYLQINPSQQWIFFFFIMSNWGCETPFVEAFLDPALKISHVGWQISWQSETNINVQYVSQPRHHPPHPALLVFTKNYCVHTIDIIVWHHWQHVFTTDELCQTRQKSNWIVGEINN